MICCLVSLSFFDGTASDEVEVRERFLLTPPRLSLLTSVCRKPEPKNCIYNKSSTHYTRIFHKKDGYLPDDSAAATLEADVTSPPD